MKFCPNCGKPVSETDAFCGGCGNALGTQPESEVQAPESPAGGEAPNPTSPPTTDAPAGQPAAPPARPPVSESPGAGPSDGSLGLPRWLGTDWPLAALCVFLFLALSAGATGVLGLAAGLIANGFGPEGLLGLVAGAFVPFAGLGSDALVGAQVDDGTLVWYSTGFALSTTIGMGAIAWLVYRSALRSVGASRDYTLAFVGKVTLLGMIAVAILGTLFSIGDIDDDIDGFGVVSAVTSAEPAWGAMLVLGIAGLVASRGRLGRPRWAAAAGLLRPLRYGMAAWAVMVLLLGTLVGVVALIHSDDANEGLAGAVASPTIVGNVGVSAQAFAMGASNETMSDEAFLSVDRYTEASLDEHVSLLHYDLPPDDGSGSAPVWLWPLLLVAPLLVFAAAHRVLRERHTQEAGSVLVQAAAVAAGFVLASWLGSLLAPLHLGAFAEGGDEAYGRWIVARPSIGGVIGLSLLWGLIGAFTAAGLWARTNRIDLFASSSSAQAAPEPQPQSPVP